MQGLHSSLYNSVFQKSGAQPLALRVVQHKVLGFWYLDCVPVEATTAVEASEARRRALLQMLRYLWLQHRGPVQSAESVSALWYKS